MDGFCSGSAPERLHWAHVCRSCSQPAGPSCFRAPPSRTHQTETANAADACSNTGRNKRATVTHSDRTSARNNIHKIAIKPPRSWWNAAFRFHHVIGCSDVCIYCPSACEWWKRVLMGHCHPGAWPVSNIRSESTSLTWTAIHKRTQIQLIHSISARI